MNSVIIKLMRIDAKGRNQMLLIHHQGMYYNMYQNDSGTLDFLHIDMFIHRDLPRLNFKLEECITGVQKVSNAKYDDIRRNSILLQGGN